MASTLRYGSETVSAAADNVQGLISAATMRDIIVSQRSGGNQVLGTTAFTVPITAGTPVAVNPLVAGAQVSGGLWSADGNNRQYPNYAAVIPDLVIPPGYKKAAQIFWSLAVQKTGSGTDDYIFQADNDGVPVGQGVTFGIGTEPIVISFLVNYTVTLDANPLIGMTVTGDGTGDDLDISAFEQFIIDFQIWSDPDA